MRFGSKVSERVNALSHEMEPFGFSLIIKKLELEDPLEETFVGEFELLAGNPALVDDADADDQLAVVSVVYLREYPIEEAGSQTVEIEKVFPSLVATRDLFSRVTRCTVERTGEA